MENLMDKKVIVRGDRSGVFFGTLAAKDGKEVKLEKCRRLWYWDGAASISQLATDGTVNPEGCKFTVTVDQIVILDAIEGIYDEKIAKITAEKDAAIAAKNELKEKISLSTCEIK